MQSAASGAPTAAPDHEAGRCCTMLHRCWPTLRAKLEYGRREELLGLRRICYMLLRAWPWHLDVQVMSTSQSSKETCRACTAGRMPDESSPVSLRHRSKKLVLTRDAWRQAWPLHGMPVPRHYQGRPQAFSLPSISACVSLGPLLSRQYGAYCTCSYINCFTGLPLRNWFEGRTAENLQVLTMLVSSLQDPTTPNMGRILV